MERPTTQSMEEDAFAGFSVEGQRSFLQYFREMAGFYVFDIRGV